ncbi:discoidin domain-containing protein [Vallitalea guaymasensis]|uniref:discoidin domain-containing protein n=1 Tax=Vallitalea guaymasensis TaxID=1185412 RepID=UPI0023556563|nr:discoidin domain-containing protein [Vallitalea guaymasensis]
MKDSIIYKNTKKMLVTILVFCMMININLSISKGVYASDVMPDTDTFTSTTNIYTDDFNDNTIDNLAVVNNQTANIYGYDGIVRLLGTSGDAFVVDNDSMDIKNGLYQFRMRPSNEARCGGLFRYASNDTYTWVGYEKDGHWRIRETIDGVASNDIYVQRDELTPYQWYTVRVIYIDKYIKVTCNGKVIYEGQLNNSQPAVSGKIGFMGWSETDNLFDDILQTNDTMATTDITNGMITVKLDKFFPQPLEYRINNTQSMLYGADAQEHPQININGTSYDVKVTSLETNGDSADYDVYIPGFDVSIHYTFTLEGNALVRRITDISGNGEPNIETITITTAIMRTVEEQSGAYGIYTFLESNGHTIRDIANSVSGFQGTYEYTDWPIIWNDNAVGAVYNNVYDYPFVFTGKTGADGKRCLAIYDNQYHYRVKGIKPDLMFESRTYIGGDINNSSYVNWEDGAIWVREQLPQLPVELKNFFQNGGNWHQVQGAYQDEKNTLGGASQIKTTYPQTLAFMKQIYYQTEGSNQVLAYVGWNGHGHDDDYPDWNPVFNPGLGGKDTAVEYYSKIKEYNGELSFHVNADDMYEDSPAYDDDILAKNKFGNRIKSWQYGALPTAYAISHFKDYKKGTMDTRRNQFLDNYWEPLVIYQDVMLVKNSPYDGYYDAEERFAMKMQADGFRQRGVYMATEYYQPLHRRNGIFVFKSRWGDSKVDNFINEGQTIYAKYYEDSNHYPGAGYKETWGVLSSNERWGNMNITLKDDIVDDTYIYALPAAYMRNYNALSWTDNNSEYKLTFTDNVVSRWDKGNNKYSLTHGDVVIADAYDRFIPSPDGTEKIFIFYDGAKSREWTLPASWNNYSFVDLYELTESGRSYIKKIPVINGKVDIYAESHTPYIIVNGDNGQPNVGPVDSALNKNTVSSSNDGSNISDKAVDGDDSTYWTANEANNQWIEIDLSHETQVNRVEIKENGSNITSYRIQYWNGSDWIDIYSDGSIGSYINKSFQTVSTEKIRLYIDTADSNPGISHFGAFSDQNLVIGKSVNASSKHDYLFSSVGNFSYTYQTIPACAIDGTTESFWAAEGETSGAWLEVDFGRLMSFDRAVINERGNAVNGFRLQYYNGSSWMDFYSGTTIGSSKEIDFNKVQGTKVRLYIDSATAEPKIEEFCVYDVGGIQYDK